MANSVRYRNGEQRIVGIIGDEDTVTGFLLAGVGDNRVMLNQRENPEEGQQSKLPPNYYVVTPSMPLSEIEEAFTTMCRRKDIGIIIICQHIANDIRHLLEEHNSVIPCILEIPSKGQKYDAEKDFVLEKITRALGIR
ncbi:putative vacuolar ATP synthase subunit [Leishmania major strain Friedlin]|uniref:V-type proton ATPase subunit F n=1 Tax=Leishmania major TaxID=5664 RepID=Q4QGP0_LEIMA|nr:putative vacuolar ATP synthase subunit [Leishmania major strain Friedlin]CAG9570460.1 vacuolar_ATP_synthase_subunit_-_putative [Leishmania major strain Friedlin]CAJ02641.1 putative vacuolar ATP synthase subunit [Leishmania major strain Friedlin]|eukprot:XP_001681658.1 putative vacuolar ATP synthase subunit [Leishmania major strain Friedlin]